MLIYFVVALIFACCFLVCFVLLYHFSKRNDPVSARLKQIGESGAELGLNNGKPARGKGSKLIGLDPKTATNLRAWLNMAGYRDSQAPYNYYLLRILGAVVLGALVFGVSEFFHLNHLRILVFSILGVIVGSLIPWLWVTRQIVKRREEIRRAVPNLLDLMVVCVEAGLSFTAAIQKLSEETKVNCKPLAEELRLVTQEILIGKSKADAFRSLANRTGVDELRSLAITLIQADKLGTSIASSLRVLADSMRFKRHQHAEEMANKTTVKLVFPLVFLIFPELLVILVGPAFIEIIKTLTDVAS